MCHFLCIFIKVQQKLKFGTSFVYESIKRRIPNHPRSTCQHRIRLEMWWTNSPSRCRESGLAAVGEEAWLWLLVELALVSRVLEEGKDGGHNHQGYPLSPYMSSTSWWWMLVTCCWGPGTIHISPSMQSHTRDHFCMAISHSVASRGLVASSPSTYNIPGCLGHGGQRLWRR